MISPHPMELVAILTGSLRVILVASLFLLNYCSLFKALSGNLLEGVHKVIACAVYSANLFYLFTWIPFVVYGFLNGTTMLVSPQSYCKTQTLTTTWIGSLFLVLLFTRGFERVRVQVFNFKPLSTFTAAFIVIATWVLPHVLLQVMNNLEHWPESTDKKSIGGNFRFIDDVVGYKARRYQFSLADDDSLAEDVVELVNVTELTVRYKIGFMICEMNLTWRAFELFVFHYFHLVLPFAILSAVCCLSLWIHRFIETRASHLYTAMSAVSKCRRSCSQLVIIDLVLCTNWAWQSVIHPLMLVHAFNLVHGSPTNILTTPAGFLDIGSHLVLTISVVFAPSQGTKQWFWSGHVPTNVYIISEQEKNKKIVSEYRVKDNENNTAETLFHEKGIVPV